MFPDFETETREFVGESGTQAFDGMAGFRLKLFYDLRYTRQADGNVAIELGHVPQVEGQPPMGPLVVTAEQFEKWFRKAK